MLENTRLALFAIAVYQFFYFVFICLLLGVVHSHKTHKNIGGVREFTNVKANRLKVTRGSICDTLVDNIAISHQYKSIKVVKCRRTGLMDCGYDSFAIVVS